MATPKITLQAEVCGALDTLPLSDFEFVHTSLTAHRISLAISNALGANIIVMKYAGNETGTIICGDQRSGQEEGD